MRCRIEGTAPLISGNDGRAFVSCCFSSPCIRQKFGKNKGVDGLISLLLCGVQVRVSVSFARREAKLREGSSFGDGKDGLDWLPGRGRRIIG